MIFERIVTQKLVPAEATGFRLQTSGACNHARRDPVGTVSPARERFLGSLPRTLARTCMAMIAGTRRHEARPPGPPENAE
jgi:hypothetical protein